MSQSKTTLEQPADLAIPSQLEGRSKLQTSAKPTGFSETKSRPDLRMIPIGELSESPTNPRRHFNEAKLKELADSIRQSGILVPLIVRKVGVKFEIVAGARRYRAAMLAGLEEVRCLVCVYSDVEALVIQVVENEQREDVEPLDQAEGYAALLKKAKMDIESIAAKVGKSTSFVYQRLKLAELIEPAKKLLAEGMITAGHAILIARLEAKDQKKALEACYQKGWNPEREDEQILSVRALAWWIQHEIHIDLSKAPWKLEDDKLVPAAGACSKCKHNTACQGDLYSELKGKPTCLLASCFNKKVEAFSKTLKQEAKAAGTRLLEIAAGYTNDRDLVKSSHWRPAKKDCKKPIKAIVKVDCRHEARDYALGELLDVCTNKQCKCWPNSFESYGAPKATAAELEKAKKNTEQIKFEGKFRLAVFAATIRAMKKVEAEYLAHLAADCLDNLDAETGEIIDQAFGTKFGTAATDPRKYFKSATLNELLLIVAACEISRDTECRGEFDLKRSSALFSAAADCKVDLKAIEQKIKADEAGAAPLVKAEKSLVELGLLKKTSSPEVNKAMQAAAKGSKAKAKPPTPAEVAKVMKAEKKKLAKKAGKGAAKKGGKK